MLFVLVVAGLVGIHTFFSQASSQLRNLLLGDFTTMGTIGSGDGDANYSRDLLPRPKSTSPDVVSGGGRELEVIDGATARLDEAESGGNVIQTDTDDRDSQYRLGRQVGKGSFGVIFVATRLSDGKQFAFKFVSGRPTSNCYCTGQIEGDSHREQERRGSDASQLRNEYRVYKALASCGKNSAAPGYLLYACSTANNGCRRLPYRL